MPPNSRYTKLIAAAVTAAATNASYAAITFEVIDPINQIVRVGIGDQPVSPSLPITYDFGDGNTFTTHETSVLYNYASPSTSLYLVSVANLDNELIFPIQHLRHVPAAMILPEFEPFSEAAVSWLNGTATGRWIEGSEFVGTGRVSPNLVGSQNEDPADYLATGIELCALDASVRGPCSIQYLDDAGRYSSIFASAYENLVTQDIITPDNTTGFPLLPGDANYDDSVDSLDLSVLASHFNLPPKLLVNGELEAPILGFPQGDFNGDQTVDLLDLSILANHFGSHQIPTPATLPLITLGLITLPRR
ncbi:hypothetical protein [Mucisphaera calidilacus]|uniref:Dockerin domain-containing protein n=1 Tax=Mucisphaera calidilacus TaxID=2527982 RepID=A0A518C0M4_9BACT|nr:hypothetical protein [Mucisphaera calidilacus]QDU72761.1 hypothetical protein Pan265_26350 [Mucisphaera calidilacus]